MIPLIYLAIGSFILSLVFQRIDLTTALNFARDFYGDFIKVEKNKALVWAVQTDKANGNTSEIKSLVINNIVAMIFSSFLLGMLGLIFNLSFLVGATMYLIAQGVAHIVGTSLNLLAYWRVKRFYQKQKVSEEVSK